MTRNPLPEPRSIIDGVRAAPELVALAEVIKLWLPGLKGDPALIAGTMRRNLLKRGVSLVSTVPPEPDEDAPDFKLHQHDYL